MIFLYSSKGIKPFGGATVTANGTTASVKKIKFLLDNFNSSDIIGTVERL